MDRILICSLACRFGTLSVLKSITAEFSHWKPSNEDLAYVIVNGKLDELKWLTVNYDVMLNFCGEIECNKTFFNCFVDAACWSGQLHVVQWLRSQDPPCPWNDETCSSAAENGHIHILQWLRTQDPPCPWDESACLSEAYNFVDNDHCYDNNAKNYSKYRALLSSSR